MSSVMEIGIQRQANEEHTGRRYSVLIIEPDNDAAKLLTLRLRKHGFHTLAVSTGAGGLRLAQSGQAAAILLDLSLPDIDGVSICEQLVDSPATCGVPVIILSGLDAPGLVERCHAAGCRYYVRKPYDPKVLVTLLDHAIDEAEDSAEESWF